MRALHRLGDWMHREPWSVVAAGLVVMHTAVVALYLTGGAVSTVPFTQEQIRAAISSPAIPAAHLIAALLLALAIQAPRVRDIAPAVSFGIWLATSAALYFAAQRRIPPLAKWGPVLAIGFAIYAFVLIFCWDRGDDERAH